MAGVPSQQGTEHPGGEGGSDPVSGAGSTSEALQFAGTAPMQGAEGLHQVIPTCTVLPEWSPRTHGLAGAMKFISLQVLLMHVH